MNWMKRITAGLTSICMGILCLPLNGIAPDQPEFVQKGSFVHAKESNAVKSNMIWDISEEAVVAKKGAKTTAELMISVTNADVAINAMLVELALDENGQADKITSIAAEQGNAYSWIVLYPMGANFVKGKMKYSGTADNNKNFIPNASDVFYITFEIPASENIDWSKAQTDANGGEYVVYGVDWADLQLINSGVNDNTIEYKVEPSEKLPGEIRVYTPSSVISTTTTTATTTRLTTTTTITSTSRATTTTSTTVRPATTILSTTSSTTAPFATKSGKCGENLTWTLDDTGTLTISGTGEMKFDGNAETNKSSGNVPWHYYRKMVKSVKAGKGVASFDFCAFWGCTNLTSVTLPDSLTRIGDGAFEYCTSLTSVTIPNSVSRIGNNTFAQCTSLTSVNIPDSVTRIGDYAFDECTSLTSVTIPDSVTKIGNYAFKDCKNLTIYGKSGSYAETYAKKNNIPFKSAGDSVTTESASTTIRYTTTTRQTTTASTTTTIRPTTTSTTSDTTITYTTKTTTTTTQDSPNSGKCGDNLMWTLDDEGTLTIYGTGKMYDWSNKEKSPWFKNAFIKTVNIENGVASIGYESFYGCSNIVTATFPDSLTSIGKFAFYDCKSLYSLTIPSGVKTIESSSFYGCTSLTSVTLPDGLISIGNSSFTACKCLTTITIPNSVTSIGEWAFMSCSNLTSVSIPDSVTIIENSAFKDCENLTSVSIPNTVTIIKQGAFAGCASLTSVIIPESVASIGYSAFAGCKILTGVSILNPKCNIDGESTFSSSIIYGYPGSTAAAYANKNNYMFRPIGSTLTWTLDDAGTLTISGTGDMFLDGNTSQGKTTRKIPWESRKDEVKSIVIEEGLTSIGNYAFSSWTNLTSVIVPSSVMSIGNNAFRYCTSLTTVVISDGVTNIGEYAFDNCTNLNSLSIPDSVTSIGGGSFSGCKSLTSVTISDGVTRIEDGTFSGCTSLTTVTIPNSVTSIESAAFSNCTNLTSVTILNPECKLYDRDTTFYNKQVDSIKVINGKETNYREFRFTGIIYGYVNSTAQAYAEKYERRFEVIGNIPITTKPLSLPQDSIKLRAEKTYRIPQSAADLTYSSLTPEIADVTANGLVTALAKGKASIKVMDGSGRTAILSIEVVPSDTEPYPLGNANGDEAINAKDAATVLIAAARLGTGGATGFTDEQSVSADVNGDGTINAKDANTILRYAAAVGTGKATNIQDYI